MQHDTTSMEVEGAKSASTLASASDASATSPTMSALAADVHRVGGADGGTHLGGPSIASDSDVAANEVRPSAPERAQETKTEIPSEPPPSATGRKGQEKKHTNNLRKLRIERMMSKAELARRANLSVLTIDRIEKGFGCRMDSKRKILEALGLSLADRVRVFGEEE